MRRIQYLILALLSLLLWSCSDGKQQYTQVKVDNDVFNIFKPMTASDVAACGLKENTPVATEYGQIVRSGSALVWQLKKGTVFTFYTDEDWDVGENLFIIGGKVIAEGIIPPMDDKNLLSEGLSIVKQGVFAEEKDKLTLGEYQDLLNEQCPPKAQARRNFLWINIIFLALFISFAVAMICLNDDTADDNKEKSGKSGKKTPLEKLFGFNECTTTTERVGVISTAICLALCVVVAVAIYLYFYWNPRESLWFITDWGFFGGLLGCGILMITVGIGAAPFFMVGDVFRKLFSKEWKKGLIYLLLLLVAFVICYFFLRMVFIQIWDQCGFIFKSLGVIVLLFFAPAGISSGFKSGSSDSGPDVVSDGNGNYYHVASRDGDRVVTTDGATRRKMPDGNYKEL